MRYMSLIHHFLRSFIAQMDVGISIPGRTMPLGLKRQPSSVQVFSFSLEGQ